MLIYGILFVGECLGKIRLGMERREAEKVCWFVCFRFAVCVCVCEGAGEGSMGSIFERGAEWANDMGAAC